MDNLDTRDLLIQLKQLVSENANLRARLEEYEFNTTIKEREMLDMKQQIINSNELTSRLDNQVMELGLLQNYIDDFSKDKNKAISGQINLQQLPGEGGAFKHQLEDLQQQYNYIKIHVEDLQVQLQDLKGRNLLLHQQASQIAELESRLADAEQERDEWKALAALKE
jgi:hypothetical protein